MSEHFRPSCDRLRKEAKKYKRKMQKEAAECDENNNNKESLVAAIAVSHVMTELANG